MGIDSIGITEWITGHRSPVAEVEAISAIPGNYHSFGTLKGLCLTLSLLKVFHDKFQPFGLRKIEDYIWFKACLIYWVSVCPA